MIVGVGAGIAIAQHLAFGDFANEQHMAAQILLLQNFAGNKCVCVLRQVVKTVVAALDRREILKLVDFPAGLHAEMLDGIEADILRQYTDVELACALNHLFGQILALAGDGEAGGIVRHLYGSVDDAAVVLVFLCGQQEEAVA